MPFTVNLIESTRTIDATATGEISRDDVLRFLTEHWLRVNADWVVLLDTTQSVSAYAPSDVLDFVAATVKVSRQPHARLALVSPDERRNMLMRQFQLRCEWQGCSGIDVFRTVEDAEAWLAVSRGSDT